MGKKCVVCGLTNITCFEIPSNFQLREKWIKAVQDFCDTSKFRDYSVVCHKHFKETDIVGFGKRHRLIAGAVPSKFESYDLDRSDNLHPCSRTINTGRKSQSTQVDFISQSEIQNLRYHRKVLTLKLKRMTQKYQKCMSKLKNIEIENEKNKDNLKTLQTILNGVEKNDEKAIFLTDIMKNYCLKTPRWSETSVRLCTIWRYCSPKGYEFCRTHLTKLPSKMTISRYLGPFNNSSDLIKQRLNAEISHFKNPIERICSLVIDDMSIREKMCYSRSEDYIYGLSNCRTTTIGEKPDIANKMLCYVIHGLSTKYTIPAGYFFHASLTSESYHTITLKILEIVTSCGFIVLRIVTDDFSANVKLFIVH